MRFSKVDIITLPDGNIIKTKKDKINKVYALKSIFVWESKAIKISIVRANRADLWKKIEPNSNNIVKKICFF